MPWVKGRLVWVRAQSGGSNTVLILRKTIGKAVARNRLKRRLRHICCLLSSSGRGLVVLAQTPAVSCSFAQLRAELSSLVAKLPPDAQR